MNIKGLIYKQNQIKTLGSEIKPSLKYQRLLNHLVLRDEPNKDGDNDFMTLIIHSEPISCFWIRDHFCFASPWLLVVSDNFKSAQKLMVPGAIYHDVQRNMLI